MNIKNHHRSATHFGLFLSFFAVRLINSAWIYELIIAWGFDSSLIHCSTYSSQSSEHTFEGFGEFSFSLSAIIVGHWIELFRVSARIVRIVRVYSIFYRQAFDKLLCGLTYRCSRETRREMRETNNGQINKFKRKRVCISCHLTPRKSADVAASTYRFAYVERCFEAFMCERIPKCGLREVIYKTIEPKNTHADIVDEERH